MQLIIIYGSEAVGKLTVAKELKRKTNLRLFDNHVSVDVGKVLFEYGEEAFNELVWKVRLLVFETAAKHKTDGIIFTWAYSHPDFQPLLDRLYRKLEPYNVDYHFVHLSCSQHALEKRVVNEDRKNADKVHTIEGLYKQQSAKNHVVIPGTNSMEIDNTELQPGEVADMIIEKLSLATKPGSK